MNAGTPGNGDDTQTSTLGLALSHEYTLLGAYIVYNADGSLKEKLYHMRNPWGNDGKYSGPWNDADPIWKDQVNKYYA